VDIAATVAAREVVDSADANELGFVLSAFIRIYLRPNSFLPHPRLDQIEQAEATGQ
jgi:hypothetical protein